MVSLGRTRTNTYMAQGARSVMEDIMTKAMFNMPSENTKEFTITLDYVKERLENK